MEMETIDGILLEFQSMGVTEAAIERSLDLKQGDIRRACLIDDPEMVALLKIVRTYPWLLEVAELGYKENSSKRIMLHNAIDIMMNKEHNDKLKKDQG